MQRSNTELYSPSWIDGGNDGNEDKDGEDKVSLIPSTLLGQERGEYCDDSGCSYSPKKNSFPTVPETIICIYILYLTEINVLKKLVKKHQQISSPPCFHSMESIPDRDFQKLAEKIEFLWRTVNMVQYQKFMKLFLASPLSQTPKISAHKVVSYSSFHFKSYLKINNVQKSYLVAK